MTHPLRRSAVSAALLLVVLFGVFPLTRALGGGYADVTMLRDAVSSSFVDFWRAGDDTLNVGLAGAVDYWARFHVVKAGLALVLLVLLFPLGGQIWRAYSTAAAFGRALLLGIAGLAHAACSALALIVLVANIQGAIAPLSSALGLMPLGAGDRSLDRVATQIQSDLANGSHSPALETLQSDFARYHFVMAALSVLVVLAVTAWAVSLLRRRSRVPREARRQRRVLLLGAGGALILGGFFGLVAAANASTAIDPGPALAGFFAGGL